MELIYALQNKIPFGPVKNAAGNFVKASLDSTTAAAASVKNMPADFRVSITNASGKDAYPIASFTYLLVPTQWKDQTKKTAMVNFLTWMLNNGEPMVTALELRSSAQAGGGDGTGKAQGDPLVELAVM